MSDNTLILKSIRGFSNYKAGSDGVIYSEHVLKDGTRKLRALKPGTFQNTGGYHSIALSKGGKVFTKRVHVLVCTAFHGKKPKGLEASHFDDDNCNNIPENLLWETRKLNMARRAANTLKATGRRHKRGLFTEDDVKNIKGLFAQGIPTKDIARLYKVSSAVIRQMRTGLTYAYDLKVVQERHGGPDDLVV